MGEVISLFDGTDNVDNRLPHGEPRIPGLAIEGAYTEAERSVLGVARTAFHGAVRNSAIADGSLVHGPNLMRVIDTSSAWKLVPLSDYNNEERPNLRVV